MAMELNVENFGSMIDNVIAGICFFEYKNNKLTPIYINEGFFRMLGYSRAEGMMYLKDIKVSIIPEDLPIFNQAIKDVLKDDGSVEVEFRTVTGNGGLRWLQVTGNLYAREKESYVIACIIQDATERKNIEEELRRQAERLHILSEAEGEKIIDYNAKTDVMVMRSPSGYGGSDEKIITKYMEDFKTDTIFEEDVEYYKAVLSGLLKSPKHDTIEFRIRRFDDDYTWYQANLTSLLGTEGYVTRIVGRMINIQDRKLRELDLVLRAEKDALTGLYNKGATEQLIKNAIEESKEDVLNALMIIDLDNFKEVNDTLGHSRGDELLTEMSGILNNIFKGGDIVGRIGGDEFMVYMKNVNTISSADILAAKVCNQIRFKVPNGDDVIKVTCSVGVAIYPYHGTNFDELFSKADKAVYTAKANGKNGYRIYDAATTMAYHSSRRAAYKPEKENAVNRSIEDLVMQILYDDKVMESALKSSIELMTVKYKLHRAYICGNDALAISRKVQYAAPGYEIGKESREHYELRRLVSEILYDSFKNFAIIHLYNLNAEEMLDYFREEGIKSMLYYPITTNGEFKGAIVFENHENAQTEFTKSEMEEIRSLLRILEAHILQIGLMDRLQDFVTQIELFDNLDSYVYIVNKDTYELSFINKKVLMEMPDVKIGDICYKALQHRDDPCENCVMNRLNKDEPHCRCTEEQFIYGLRCWARCSISWLECKDENGLALINCIDISEYFTG